MLDQSACSIPWTVAQQLPVAASFGIGDKGLGPAGGVSRGGMLVALDQCKPGLHSSLGTLARLGGVIRKGWEKQAPPPQLPTSQTTEFLFLKDATGQDRPQ